MRRKGELSPAGVDAVDQEKIKDIEIVRTVTGGNTVYQS
jgi:hypothetical protein